MSTTETNEQGDDRSSSTEVETQQRLLEKENHDKELLRNMKTHYWARMHVYKARMKILQRRLNEALMRKKKRTNPRILVEASLTHHGTH